MQTIEYLKNSLPAEFWESPDNVSDAKHKIQEFEEYLIQDLKILVSGYELPGELLHASDPNNKWKIVSSMQKAIRWGLPTDAINAAHAGVMLDANYVFRRLAVTAIEDVFAGDLYGCLLTLAALKSVKIRREIGEAKLACYLAGRMAANPKDRMVCEACVIVDFNPDHNKTFQYGFMSDAQLQDVMDTGDYESKFIAAWALAGNRFKSSVLSEKNERSIHTTYKYWLNRGLPLPAYYIMYQTVSRLNEALSFMSPFMWEMLANHKGEPTVDSFDIPPFEYKQGLLSGALDMHTRDGKIAFSLLRKKNPALQKKYFVHLPDQKMVGSAIGCGYFLAEGGVLATRMNYGDSAALYKLSHGYEISKFGIPKHLHAQYLQELRDNIPFLNKQRDTAIWMTQQDQKKAS